MTPEKEMHRQLPEPGAAARELVLASLEDDQLVAAKAHRLQRRKLGRGAKILMWGLRLYVVAMVVVVVYVLVHGA